MCHIINNFLTELAQALRGVTNHSVPMDLLYPDDSYPGSDVTYPTLWTICTQQIMTQNIYFIYPNNRKTIKMHACTHRCMCDLIYYIVVLNLTISVSGPCKVSVISFESLKAEAKTEPVQQFFSYINENWICSTVWPPKA